MKKNILLTVALLTVFSVSLNKSNAYYDVVEVEGTNGTEYIINVSGNNMAVPNHNVDYKYEAKSTPTMVDTPKTINKVDFYSNNSVSTKEYQIMPETKHNIEQLILDKNTVSTSDNTNNIENKKEIFQETITKHEKVKYYNNWSTNEALTKIKSIGNGLVSSNGIKQIVNFTITDNQDVVNATTSGDGTINIYTGILPFCESEDELAFIIGHELGHAASYHVAKTVATNTVAGTANEVGKRIAVSKIQGALGRTPMGGVFSNVATSSASTAIDATTVAGTSKVGRVMESNADLLACDYMVKKGYNPVASISILYKIGENYPDLFSDHPSTDKRIATVYEYINKKYPKYLKNGYNTEAYNSAMKQLKRN